MTYNRIVQCVVGIICGVSVISPIEAKNQTDTLKANQVQQDKDGFAYYIDFPAMPSGAITVDNIREYLGITGKYYLEKRDLDRVLDIVRKGHDTRITTPVFSELGVHLLVEDRQGNTLFAVDDQGVVQMGKDVFSLKPKAFLEISGVMEYRIERSHRYGTARNAVNSNSSAIMVAKGFIKDNKPLQFMFEKGKYSVSKKDGVWYVECSDGKNRIHVEIIASNGRLSNISDVNLNEMINKRLN